MKMAKTSSVGKKKNGKNCLMVKNVVHFKIWSPFADFFTDEVLFVSDKPLSSRERVVKTMH